MDSLSLRRDLKSLLVTSARLPVAPDDILDDEPLFEGRFGLDSLDALQLAVGLEEKFGVQVPDTPEGRSCFRSINTLATFVEENLPDGAGDGPAPRAGGTGELAGASGLCE